MTEDKGNGFFRGATHRVILGSPTLQSSNRRICVPLRMPLTGESFADMPDWISTAYDAVAKSFPSVDAPVDVISDITLAFHNGKPNDKLFAEPSAKVPHSELKKFVCLRTEDPDDADIELQFKAYSSYSRDYWEWLGEIAGTKADIYMAFPTSMGVVQPAAAKSGTLDLDAEDEEDSNPLDTEAGRTGQVVVVPSAALQAKSGPKELAAFHEKEVSKGRSSKRPN